MNAGLLNILVLSGPMTTTGTVTEMLLLFQPLSKSILHYLYGFQNVARASQLISNTKTVQLMFSLCVILQKSALECLTN